MRRQRPDLVNLQLRYSARKMRALVWLLASAAALDWALTPNIFLRGEFEYVQFAPIANIVASIATARVGAGFKF